MQCPKCENTSLSAIVTSKQNVELNRCPKCKGTWFDANELEAILGKKADRDFTIPKYAQKGHQTSCPCCHVNLHEFCYPGTEVLVDACKQCGGVWLDNNEWKQIGEARDPTSQMTCPKCSKEQAEGPECIACGIVIANFQASEENRQEQQSQIEHTFADAYQYKITQQIEWLEVLSPFERKNRYDVAILVRDGVRNANRLGTAQEYSKSFMHSLGLQFMGSMRSFNVKYVDQDENELLEFNKPMAFYFHTMTIKDTQGRNKGSVRRRFHLFRHVYDLCDRRGRPLLRVRGPIAFLKIRLDWHFVILKGDKEVGKITKKFKGIMREAFTDADNFSCRFDHDLDLTEKLLVFANALMIDLLSFENNTGDGGMSFFDW